MCLPKQEVLKLSPNSSYFGALLSWSEKRLCDGSYFNHGCKGQINTWSSLYVLLVNCVIILHLVLCTISSGLQNILEFLGNGLLSTRTATFLQRHVNVEWDVEDGIHEPQKQLLHDCLLSPGSACLGA